MHRSTPIQASFRGYTSGGARTVIDAADDSKLMQESGGGIMKGENRQKVESPQNYGFTSVVMDADKGPDGQVQGGAEGFHSFMGGNRSFPVCTVMDDRRHRLKDLQKGDTAIYRTKDDKQQFHLTQDGGFWSAPQDKTARMQLVANQQSGQQQQGQQGGQQQKPTGQQPVYKGGQKSDFFFHLTSDGATASGKNVYLRSGSSFGDDTSNTPSQAQVAARDGAPQQLDQTNNILAHAADDMNMYLGDKKGNASFLRVMLEDGSVAVNTWAKVGGGGGTGGGGGVSSASAPLHISSNNMSLAQAAPLMTNALGQLGLNIAAPLFIDGSGNLTSAPGASGPVGPVGPAGPTGPIGATGATGFVGPAGASGPAGPTGASGAVGPAGASGATGPIGASGAAGPQGASGLTGAAGASGATGPVGTTGAAGASGATGPIGPAGASGATGPTGAAGGVGASGATGPVAQTVPNCGRLGVTGTTTINFYPYQGDLIKINGAIYNIPSGGVTLTNSGLAASALYYVYIYNNAGTLTLAVSGTGHARSGTAGNIGVEILSGNDAYTLVGMVWTNASAQFVDNGQFRCCLSWFNRKSQNIGISINNQSNGNINGAYSSMMGSTQAPILLNWADEVVSYAVDCQCSANANSIGSLALSFDSTTTNIMQNQYIYQTTLTWPVTIAGHYPSTEGAHSYFVIACGSINATAGTLGMNNTNIWMTTRG
jgi:phage gp45-like